MSERPFKPTVLAAFDGRVRTPVRAGALLADALDARMHVVEAYRFEVRGRERRALNRRRFERAAHRLDAVCDATDGDVATSVLPTSDPAEAVLDAATAVDACLVALGPDEHGHVVRDVLSRARCPVLVAPDDALLIPTTIDAIAVAWDFGIGSRMALAAAGSIARATGARVRVVHWCFGDDKLEAMTDAVRDALGPELPSLDVAIETRHGAPAPMIRELSDEADLLVSGSRGRGRVGRRLLGSVSATLVDHPPVPVLVVPAHARLRPAQPLGLTTAHPL